MKCDGNAPAGKALLKRYRSKVAARESAMVAGQTDRQMRELHRGLLACRIALSGGHPH